jgi:hypothetical protein
MAAHAAAATPSDIELLRKDLTPVGGEKAANEAGSVPAWEGMTNQNYDAQGKVWQTKEAGFFLTWEVAACTGIVQQNFYDFSSGRYVADSVSFDA